MKFRTTIAFLGGMFLFGLVAPALIIATVSFAGSHALITSKDHSYGDSGMMGACAIIGLAIGFRLLGSIGWFALFPGCGMAFLAFVLSFFLD